MRIERPTGETQQRRRKTAKQIIHPAVCAIYISDECSLSEVVLEILNPLLAGAETEFEPPQPLVGQRGPSQMQRDAAVGSTPRDGSPHHQIVRAQLLEVVIRRPEFVKGLPGIVKKNCGCHRPTLKSHNRDETVAGLQHVSCDVLKKSKGLRRHAVPTSSQAVQCIEGSHRFEAVVEFDLQTRFFCLAYAPSNCPFETLEELFLTTFEFDYMRMKCERR